MNILLLAVVATVLGLVSARMSGDKRAKHALLGGAAILLVTISALVRGHIDESFVTGLSIASLLMSLVVLGVSARALIRVSFPAR